MTDLRPENANTMLDESSCPVSAQSNNDITDCKTGKPVNRKKAFGIIIAVIIIAIIVALLFLGSQGKTDSGDGYKITDQKIETIDSLPYITGRVNNTCGRKETIAMTWHLYNSSGTEIGTALGAAENIDAGETADFKAIVILNDINADPSEIASFELSGVTFLKQENAKLQAEIDAYKKKSK